MKKKILYIDLDMVSANLMKAVKDIDPSFQISDDAPNFDVMRERLHEICISNPMIFHNLEPMPGAIKYIKKLFPLYEVYFLSTPMWELPESFTGKRIWLEKYFGNEATDKLILTARKDLAIGDILVDDRLKNGAADFKGKFIHFGQKQCPTWKETFAELQYLARIN